MTIGRPLIRAAEAEPEPEALEDRLDHLVEVQLPLGGQLGAWRTSA